MKQQKQYCAPVALLISVGETDIIRTSSFDLPVIPIDPEEQQDQ